MLTDNEAVADPEDHAGEGEGGSWGRAPTSGWGRIRSQIMHAKSSKPPRMFQWDAVATSPDLWIKNSFTITESALVHQLLV